MAREVMGGNGLVTDYHVGKQVSSAPLSCTQFTHRAQFVDLEAVHTFEGSYDVNTLYVLALFGNVVNTDRSLTESLHEKSLANQRSRSDL